jgi:eukaryotic-like serine/threonine-protein kinase
MSLAPGVLIAQRYELIRLLGEGGMGVVWSALHTVTQKPVALKFLKAPASQEMILRFIREARAVGSVRHPNVIEIHDIFTLDDGLPAMVMDLLEGESLADKLERSGALAWDELARIMVPVLSAVGAAHAAGVIHRDLKPDNIFLSQLGDGRVAPIVFDFGICKLNPTESLVGNSSALTEAGFMMGTPAYMAPEQVYAEADVDARADVWALGVIMYECATGKRPVEGESLGQMIKIITTGPITPIDHVAPHLPPLFSDLINRMLRHDRNERPADLREPLATLRGLLPAPAQDSANDWLAPSIPPPRTTSGEPSTISHRPRSPSGVASPIVSNTHQAEPSGPTARTLLLGLLALTALGFVAGLLLLGRHASPATAASSLAERNPAPPVSSTPLSTAPRAANTANTDTSASVTAAAPASAAHKRQRAPSVVSGFQSFNTGRK